MTKVFPSGKQLVTSPMLFKQFCEFSKPLLGPNAIDSPIWRQAPQVGLADPNYAFTLFDDFLGYITTQNGWTTTGGTIAINEAYAGGVVSIATSGVDNDAGFIARTYEEFSVSASKKLFFETRLLLTEAATNVANVFAGVTQGTVADAVPLLNDAGGEVIADDDSIGIVKSDGGTTWDCYTGDGAAAYQSTTGPTRTSGSWVRLGFIADPTQVDFYVDGNLVGTHTTVVPTADEEMTLCIGIKEGGGGAETLLIDWVKCVQIR